MFWSLSMFGLDNGMTETYLKRVTKQGKGRNRLSYKHSTQVKGARHSSLRSRGNRLKTKLKKKNKR